MEETGLMNAKPVDTPMDPSVKLVPDQGEPFADRKISKVSWETTLSHNHMS